MPSNSGKGSELPSLMPQIVPTFLLLPTLDIGLFLSFVFVILISFFKNNTNFESFFVVPWIKDQALSLQWLGLLL